MNGDERTQYQNAMYLINRKLKDIGKMIGVQLPLTVCLSFTKRRIIVVLI